MRDVESILDKDTNAHAFHGREESICSHTEEKYVKGNRKHGRVIFQVSKLRLDPNRVKRDECGRWGI